MRTHTFVGLGVAALAMAIAGACTLDVDRFQFAGTGGANTGGAGTGGSGTECDVPSDCAGQDDDCQTRTCESGFCGMDYASAGTACSDGGEGTVCDGSGDCVECLTEAECDGEDLCEANHCVPQTCQNDELDPGETDVDCGGTLCNPCADGLDCLVPTDCQSLFCNTVGECAPCVDHVDCPDTYHCDDGVCAPGKTNGEACTDGAQCASGNCPSQDQVCCDLSCGGKCRACLYAKTGAADGTCADVTGGSDPDSECGNASICQGNHCNGSGACQLLTNNEICEAQHCSGGSVHYADHCNASGQCVDGGSSACEPYACSGNDCATTCLDHPDCHPDYWCDDPGGAVCEPDRPQGQWCSSDQMCQGNIHCVDGFCCDGPCTGICKSCRGLATVGGTNGTCDNVKSLWDPDNDCPAQLECCDGNGSCGPNGGYPCETFPN